MSAAPSPVRAGSPPARPAQAALDRTADWIRQFGGRLAGTPASRQAAAAVRAALAEVCGGAALEPFITRPGAFNGFYRIDAVLYLVGFLFLCLDRPLPAALVLTFIFTSAGLEFGWYREFYDFLFPARECANVTAVLEPLGPVRQQLIFSGHHDSALELNFLKSHQKLYGLKIIIPDEFRALGMVSAWAWFLWQRFAGVQPAFVLPLKLLLLVGIYFVFTKFFLFGPRATPGAGDNLIASAMLVDLARALAHPQARGSSILRHTRLLFVSFDAEEAGLRGSRAWVRAHRAGLDACPTLALNIDSIYHAADLQFMVSDLNSHIQLDRALVETCQALALRSGYPAGQGVMRFGGGATDAAELAKAGVRATTMIAMPTALVRDGLVYHTMRDTVDAVEPAAVDACLSVAEGLALELDRRASA